MAAESLYRNLLKFWINFYHPKWGTRPDEVLNNFRIYQINHPDELLANLLSLNLHDRIYQILKIFFLRLPNLEISMRNDTFINIQQNCHSQAIYIKKLENINASFTWIRLLVSVFRLLKAIEKVADVQLIIFLAKWRKIESFVLTS